MLANQILKFIFASLFAIFSSILSYSSTFEYEEKIYIHFDKSTYDAGETIWFKTYLVSSQTHSTATPSKIVYVELINPDHQILETKTIKISDGGGHGDFKLSTNLASGTFMIRAYTNYMRNFNSHFFYRQELAIFGIKDGKNPPNSFNYGSESPDSLSVQFFPEGGVFVNNMVNRIAFKAENENGRGIKISGTIVNSLGEEITKFKTSHHGLGVFNLKPTNGLTYKAIIKYKDKTLTYSLAKALDHGFVMRILEKKDHFNVYIHFSKSNNFNNYSLTGTQRNGRIFEEKIQSKKNEVLIKVPKHIATQGIIRFTLLDQNNNQVLKRLIFNEPQQKNRNVNISALSVNPNKRELVELEIALDSVTSALKLANLSISVNATSVINQDPARGGIKSQLLLKSELNEIVEKSEYYFDTVNLNRKAHLDLLLMTVTWRDSNHKKHEDKKGELVYPPEENLSLSGRVYQNSRLNNTVTSDISLSFRNKAEIAYENRMTDASGEFKFDNLNFQDSTLVILQSKKLGSKRTATGKYFITLDSIQSPEISIKKIIPGRPLIVNRLPPELRKQEYHRQLITLDKDAVALDEIVLETTVSKKQKSFEKRRELYRNPTHTLDYEIYRKAPIGPHALTALHGRVPGVQVNGEKITVRGYLGATQPLFLVDGIPVDKEIALRTPITDIHFVDVLLGAKAAIYGMKAGNGVIAIYTLIGNEPSLIERNKARSGSLKFIHPGYSQAKEFPKTNYSSSALESDKFDYRPTVYWNPTLKFDAQGKAKVSFYTSDIISDHHVLIEGISPDGQIIRAEYVLKKGINP